MVTGRLAEGDGVVSAVNKVVSKLRCDTLPIPRGMRAFKQVRRALRYVITRFRRLLTWPGFTRAQLAT
jgi:hypothetical protein